MEATVRPAAWTLSLGVHGALVGAALLAFGAGRLPPAGPPLARLVWVEPAPPRAGSTAVTTEAQAPRRMPVAEQAPVREATDTMPPPLPKALAHATRPHPAATAHPRLAPATIGPTTASAPGPTAGGAALGAVAGGANGTVGGLGDAPLTLRDVAAPPELVERIMPDYPAQARALRIEGQVVLEVVLDRAGRVEEPSIRVMRSVPMLDAAAVSAVRRWRFRPARSRDGLPVRVLMEIPVRFVLR